MTPQDLYDALELGTVFVRHRSGAEYTIHPNQREILAADNGIAENVQVVGYMAKVHPKLRGPKWRYLLPTRLEIVADQ